MEDFLYLTYYFMKRSKAPRTEEIINSKYKIKSKAIKRDQGLNARPSNGAHSNTKKVFSRNQNRIRD